MSNPADKHIVDLIENLCHEAAKRTFHSDSPQRQEYINQIAQLRASMNPVIHQYVKS